MSNVKHLTDLFHRAQTLGTLRILGLDYHWRAYKALIGSGVNEASHILHYLLIFLLSDFPDVVEPVIANVGKEYISNRSGV